MDFEKKYPLTQLPGEYILVQWSRGYKEVELFYKGESIAHIQGAMKLQKGVTVSSDLGVIKLKLSEKPVTLDVIVDGFHSPVNVSHPAKQLKSASTFFWTIAVFSLFGALMDGLKLSSAVNLATIITVVNLVILTCYVLAAVFTAKSRPWAFFLGFSVYGLMTLYTVLILLVFPHWTIIFGLIIRGIFIYFLSSGFKNALEVIKHSKFAVRSIDHILDMNG